MQVKLYTLTFFEYLALSSMAVYVSFSFLTYGCIEKEQWAYISYQTKPSPKNVLATRSTSNYWQVSLFALNKPNFVLLFYLHVYLIFVNEYKDIHQCCFNIVIFNLYSKAWRLIFYIVMLCVHPYFSLWESRSKGQKHLSEICSVD